jgi:hypothetical protein
MRQAAGRFNFSAVLGHMYPVCVLVLNGLDVGILGRNVNLYHTGALIV